VRALLARRWKRTRGRVIGTFTTKDSYGGDRILHTSPSVTYEYVVNDIRYTGHRISLTGHGVSNSSWGALNQMGGQFRRGRRVRVWYDPNCPDRATLVRDFGFASPAIFFVGVFMVAFGLLVMAAPS
jgi:hypothetical protein